MKKFVVWLLALCFVAGMGFSQAVNLDQYQKGIEDFADDLATVLPLNASIGLNWNDAYIGQILDVPPHFGIGVTVGATSIPYAPIKNLVEDAMGGDSTDIPSYIKNLGVPVPAGAIDARIGGFFLPFDIGVKFGYLKLDISDVEAEYLLLGGDVRYCLLEQLAAIPKISVGVGFNYMKADATLSGVLDATTIDAASAFGGSGTHEIRISSPDLYLEMETKVIDFKVQASWNLLIVEPSLGLGASYGFSKVAAGAESKLNHNGAPITSTEIALLEDEGFDVDGKGIGYTKNVSALTYRAFGGVGFILPFVRLDLGLLYGINAGSWGATFGGRFQL
ncbi:MAG: hypothetical protein LBT33_02930 [Spirochaetia bacterium]|jgi:hypothetical protein|nr:hypothetical protein [Spirochaetia bacterium]